MGDRLTQLQEAVDQLAHQFVACLHFVNQKHSLQPLGPDDVVRDLKQESEQKEVDALPPDEFRAGLVELSRDLVVTEQQIEMLISTLPGLDSSEAEQEKCIRELEEEVRVAEAQRLDAVKEKNQVLADLGQVIRSIRRP